MFAPMTAARAQIAPSASAGTQRDERGIIGLDLCLRRLPRWWRLSRDQRRATLPCTILAGPQAGYTM